MKPETILPIALKQLRDCGDFLLPHDSFLTQVKLASSAWITPVEFRSACDRWEAEGLMVSVVDELTGARKYKITGKGKALLLEHGL